MCTDRPLESNRPRRSLLYLIMSGGKTAIYFTPIIAVELNNRHDIRTVERGRVTEIRRGRLRCTRVRTSFFLLPRSRNQIIRAIDGPVGEGQRNIIFGFGLFAFGTTPTPRDTWDLRPVSQFDFLPLRSSRKD